MSAGFDQDEYGNRLPENEYSYIADVGTGDSLADSGFSAGYRSHDYGTTDKRRDMIAGQQSVMLTDYDIPCSTGGVGSFRPPAYFELEQHGPGVRGSSGARKQNMVPPPVPAPPPAGQFGGVSSGRIGAAVGESGTKGVDILDTLKRSKVGEDIYERNKIPKNFNKSV